MNHPASPPAPTRLPHTPPGSALSARLAWPDPMNLTLDDLGPLGEDGKFAPPRLRVVRLVVSDTHFGDDLSWSGIGAGHEARVLREIAQLMTPTAGVVKHLYHLGDVVSSHLSVQEQHLWLARLSAALRGGRCTITRGNHDKRSDAEYRAHGLEIVDAVVDQGVYFSHRGIRELPEDAVMQVLGHYHTRAPNPELQHAFKFDLKHEGLRPVLLDKIVQRAERAGLRRARPTRADDCWNVPRGEDGRKLKLPIDPDAPTGNVP